MFVLVALVSVACGGESVPDDQAVRAEVVPRIEATFEEISLVAGLGESENFCPARVGLGGYANAVDDRFVAWRAGGPGAGG